MFIFQDDHTFPFYFCDSINKQDKAYISFVLSNVSKSCLYRKFLKHPNDLITSYFKILGMIDLWQVRMTLYR